MSYLLYTGYCIQWWTIRFLRNRLLGGILEGFGLVLGDLGRKFQKMDVCAVQDAVEKPRPFYN